MARIVVVGGGFAGMSAAARLAKLRHEVILLEASDTLGGRLRGVELDGERWPLDPETMTLPGVVRDLFKKSGRPLERVLDLVPTEGRRHVFNDRSVLDLPMGTRSSQHDAVTTAFDEDRWSEWVDQWADVWDVFRRSMLDQMPDEKALTRAARKTMRSRDSIKSEAKPLKDPRLKSIVLDRIALADSDLRSTPAMVAAWHYVERNFGMWRFEGGHAALADALTTRLEERKVDVRLGVRATDLTAGPTVVTGDGDISADIVIWCGSRQPPSARQVGMPAVPASRTFVTVDDKAPELPAEILVHDRWAIRLFSAGPGRWAIEHRTGEDPLLALARNTIDLRPHVIKRHDLDPSDVAGLAHWGYTWIGFGSLFRRPGVNPKDGVFYAGALGPFGASLEEIGMGTAAIANAIGPAPR